MKVSDFNYDLPEELIAQVPIKNRDTSRLMVLNRKNQAISHKIFKDIIDYLEPGDCLVRNNTKVIPARLYGIKEETGITVEFLLLNRLEAKKSVTQEKRKVSEQNQSKGNDENNVKIREKETEEISKTKEVVSKNEEKISINSEIWEVMVRPR